MDPVRWAVVLAMITAVAAGVVWLRRRAARRLAERRAELLTALARQISDARPGTRLPAVAPKPASPFLPSIPVLAEGSDGRARCYLYDTDERPRESIPGYNNSLGGANRDIRLAAHTVLAWHLPGVDLPAFRVLPNPGLDLDPHEVIEESVRRVGADEHDPQARARARKIASASMRIGTAIFGRPQSWDDLRDESGALEFPDPAFEAAFRVLGDEPEFVRRLFTPEVVDILRRQPGAIVECSGEWFFTSLNTSLVRGHAGASESGFLSGRVAELLVHRAEELRPALLEALQRPPST